MSGLPRRTTALLGGFAMCAALAGCQWSGLNSLQLPGTKGHGPGSYHVVIDMPDVTTITANSPVLVDDVEVGSITTIAENNWQARVTVALDGDVVLPANATAKIGQTSLLGSTHIELAAPANPRGRLADGAVIPIDRAGEYPTTEQALAALALVLNGGGIAQLRSIVTEAAAAIVGHQGSIDTLIAQLNTLLGTLNAQHDAIAATLGNLDRLATTLARGNDTLARAVSEIDPALGVLADQRRDLTNALSSLSRFGTAGADLVRQTRADLLGNLADLAPALRNVANTGTDLVDNLSELTTFPFPQSVIDTGMRGDYTNLWAVADLTIPRVRSGLLFGTPWYPPPPAGHTGATEGASR